VITDTDRYESAGTLVEIPLDDLEPDPGNPRDKLRRIDELAASIREVGILQPLVVTRNGNDRYRIVVGHRRHAAAKKAKLTTVPCIVRDNGIDRARLIHEIIENVQRDDLNPIEEAKAYNRLLKELDVTQAEIAARCGVSEAHVSKRLSLLALPTDVRKRVGLPRGDEQRITLEEAYELSKLADHPDRIRDVLTDPDPIERRYYLEQQVEEVEREQKLTAARADLAAKGKRVVDNEGYNPKSYARLAKETWERGIVVDRRKHAKEPCAAVVLEWDGRKCNTVPVCTDPERHTKKGASTLKDERPAGPTPTRSGKSPREKKREAEERDAAKARKAFMSETVRARPVDELGIDIVDLALRRYLADAAHVELLKMCDLLGLTPPKGAKANDRPGPTIGKYIAQSSTNRLRACLAFALTQGEWSSPWSYQREHRELLITLGYEPTELERKEWGLDKKRKAKSLGEARQEHREQRAQPDNEPDPIDEANDAADRVLERARELELDDPRIRTLVDELDEGPGPRRAREIRNELDGIFAELNDLQPGDVVDVDAEGRHVIERAEPIDEGSTAEEAEGTEISAGQGDSRRPPRRRPAVGSSSSPPNSGDSLDDYVKPPKDCNPHEQLARLEIRDFQHRVLDDPDDAETLDALQQELYAGVTVKHAKEILEALATLRGRARLTGYLREPNTDAERKARALIGTLIVADPDNDELAELQQELFAGFPDNPDGKARARAIHKRLTRLCDLLGQEGRS